jgi:hypothetical protein
LQSATSAAAIANSQERAIVVEFQYLLQKVENAEIENYPFPHVHIRNFFSDAHFAQITSAAEVVVPAVQSDERLFDELFRRGYKIIDFPGCIIDRDVYVKWHRERGSTHNLTNTSCEGFGMTLRLRETRSAIITELTQFMASPEFQLTLAAKFGLDLSALYYDNGIQKYLDGYEISPHPDTRNKALTYMVNINPGVDSERQNHHTHYLQFKDEFKYVESYWLGHPEEDRCWVPWSWCESRKVQRENNSIVIFSPTNSTMHAVKASYNHLASQRTQMYGNLWYRQKQTNDGPRWEDFVIHLGALRPSIQDRIKSIVPAQVKGWVKPKREEDDKHVISNRLKVS